MLFIRRKAYELFKKLHSVASLTLLVGLWLHTDRSPFVIVTLALCSGSLLLEKFVSYIFLLYRNVPSSRASFQRYGEIVRVEITLRRAWKSRSGQFLYLCLPRLRRLGLGIFEFHPFMIAWDYISPEPNGSTVELTTRKIVLLAQPSNGFTKRLLKTDEANNHSLAIIDGPYGSDLHSFKDYDTVLFMANGIGLAGLLLPIRHLIVAHNNQTARVRRITLHWLLETKRGCTAIAYF